MNGSVKLSYWAESTRNTKVRPRTKITSAWLPARTSSQEIPDHSKPSSAGSTWWAAVSMAAIASPLEVPGVGVPASSIDR